MRDFEKLGLFYLGSEFDLAAGRKTVSVGTLGRATTAARGVGRSMKEASDVQRASESAEAVQQQAQELEEALRTETQAIASRFDGDPVLDRLTLAPKRWPGHDPVGRAGMGSQVKSSRASRMFVAAVLLVAGGTSACGRADVASGVTRLTRTEVRELHPAKGELALPLKNGSVRFAVIGDSGRGDQAQHDVAQQMIAWRQRFPFDFVVMLGDNIYGPHTPDDFVKKFEEPYRPLLDAGVTFHAAIGNHDESMEINYDKFNMGGERYYTFRRSEHRLQGLAGAGVRFFVLDSRSFDPKQLTWLHDELAKSGTAWKICYFHHPLYTSGRYSAGARSLRLVLEPMLIEGDVDAVLSGHEHFYERTVPQHGISYFISGGAGSLRRGDIRASPLVAKGFDTDYHFMLMEIAGDELYFQAISRTGDTVDAGVIIRRNEP